MEHTITIDNITDSEVLTYPLVLLKGTVINQNQNVCSPPDDIIINSSSHKLHDNKFKCLLELVVGENCIKLHYCCVEKEFRVIYTPRSSELVVRPLYIICDGHDGRFQAPEDEDCSIESACRRITIGCELLQLVLAEKLSESNFGRKTFTLEKCVVFHSKLDFTIARCMKQDELWTQLGREIVESSIGSSNVKYLGFLSCTHYHGEKYEPNFQTHEELLNITDAYVALGGGGLGIFGTACLYTWAENIKDILSKFADDRHIDKTKFLDDSAYRGTRGACFSTTLGSVLHELCHTFDLGHTDVGIMGRGFDNIRNIFLPHETSAKKHPEIEKRPAKTYETLVSFKLKDADSKSFFRGAQFSDEIINKTVCVDDTCFTKSSACILAYHKWFNSYIVDDKKFILTYDDSIKLVKSTLGIRVVEIRRDDNEMVTLNWCFGGKILRYNFQIDDDAWSTLAGDKCTLFVQDNAGNILKLAI